MNAICFNKLQIYKNYKLYIYYNCVIISDKMLGYGIINRICFFYCKRTKTNYQKIRKKIVIRNIAFYNQVKYSNIIIFKEILYTYIREIFIFKYQNILL